MARAAALSTQAVTQPLPVPRKNAGQCLRPSPRRVHAYCRFQSTPILWRDQKNLWLSWLPELVRCSAINSHHLSFFIKRRFAAKRTSTPQSEQPPNQQVSDKEELPVLAFLRLAQRLRLSSLFLVIPCSAIRSLFSPAPTTAHTLSVCTREHLNSVETKSYFLNKLSKAARASEALRDPCAAVVSTTRPDPLE